MSYKKISCDEFWSAYDNLEGKRTRDPDKFVAIYKEQCCHVIKSKQWDLYSGINSQNRSNIRFVVISDTHCRPIDTEIPYGDVLIHCGDMTMRGFLSEFVAFNEWMGTLPHPNKIGIAGNHDRSLEIRPLNAFFQTMGQADKDKLLATFTNFTYLEDETINLFGYKIYGAPWTPVHLGGFQKNRGCNIMEKWKQIPIDTDILVTHGPAAGVGDITKRHHHAGCVDLLHEIQTRVKPLYHCFGHIHEGSGVYTDGITTYLNAALCDIHYRARQPAWVFDLPIKTVDEECSDDCHGESNNDLADNGEYNDDCHERPSNST